MLVEEAIRKGTIGNGVLSCGRTSGTSYVLRGARRGLGALLPATCLPPFCPTCNGSSGYTARQAVSLWKALQTQQWRRDTDKNSVGGAFVSASPPWTI